MNKKLISRLLFFWMIVASMAKAQAPDTLWTHIYETPLAQYANDVCEAKGGYVIAGVQETAQNNSDIFLLKINYAGYE
jgi:hypothetical protein